MKASFLRYDKLLLLSGKEIIRRKSDFLNIHVEVILFITQFLPSEIKVPLYF